MGMQRGMDEVRKAIRKGSAMTHTCPICRSQAILSFELWCQDCEELP